MTEKPYVKLKPSEAVVVDAASRLLSAYIIAGQFDENNENKMIEKALHIATKLAIATDRLIRSDDERL